MPEAPAPELARRLERLLGGRICEARPATGGYTPAERWVLRLDDGRAAFAKVATSERISGWLRREAWIYERIRAPFLPEYLGFEDHPERAVLLLEDLAAAHWPPEWRPGDVEAVLETLRELHEGDWPRPARAVAFADGTGGLDGWPTVAEDPGPFLGLGLVEPSWLERYLPTLVAHEEEVELQGDALCHFDVRSDNLCLSAGRAKLVDWNLASAGNPRFDLAFFLPSLRAEGGPRPEEVLPDAPRMAAGVSGFFAARAGLPFLPAAPGVRAVQLQQLRPALAWACRALDLPVPDAVADS